MGNWFAPDPSTQLAAEREQLDECRRYGRALEDANRNALWMGAVMLSVPRLVQLMADGRGSLWQDASLGSGSWRLGPAVGADGAAAVVVQSEGGSEPPRPPLRLVLRPVEVIAPQKDARFAIEAWAASGTETALKGRVRLAPDGTLVVGPGAGDAWWATLATGDRIDPRWGGRNAGVVLWTAGPGPGEYRTLAWGDAAPPAGPGIVRPLRASAPVRNPLDTGLPLIVWTQPER